MLPGPAVPGSCLISFHFRWGKLSTRTVVGVESVCVWGGLPSEWLALPFSQVEVPPDESVDAILSVEAAPRLARLQPELDSHQCEGEIRAVANLLSEVHDVLIIGLARAPSTKKTMGKSAVGWNDPLCVPYPRSPCVQPAGEAAVVDNDRPRSDDGLLLLEPLLKVQSLVVWCQRSPPKWRQSPPRFRIAPGSRCSRTPGWLGSCWWWWCSPKLSMSRGDRKKLNSFQDELWRRSIFVQLLNRSPIGTRTDHVHFSEFHDINWLSITNKKQHMLSLTHCTHKAIVGQIGSWVGIQWPRIWIFARRFCPAVADYY